MTLNLIHQVRAPSEATGLAPAVVLVHGWLGNETVMWAFERALPPNAYAISVRAPFEAEGGYGWMLDGQPGTFEQGLAALQTFVAEVPNQWSVDAGRLVVMGFSQGAAMAYALLLSNPAACAGVAALGGFIPPQADGWVAPGRLTGKPVFIAHGTEDETVPVLWAEEAKAVLTESGASVTYVTDPTGHKIGTQGMRALKTWLGGI